MHLFTLKRFPFDGVFTQYFAQNFQNGHCDRTYTTTYRLSVSSCSPYEALLETTNLVIQRCYWPVAT